jgi:hypothetical protein
MAFISTCCSLAGIMSAWVIITDGVVEGVGVSVPGLWVLWVWYNAVRLGEVVKISGRNPLRFCRNLALNGKKIIHAPTPFKSVGNNMGVFVPLLC